jgi:hypothetical protein
MIGGASNNHKEPNRRGSVDIFSGPVSNERARFLMGSLLAGDSDALIDSAGAGDSSSPRAAAQR